MIQKFDYYRQSEKPEFILCNPDDTQICVLTVSDTKCVLRYNDTSEISFQVTEGCTDGYELLETNREVLVEGLGYFIIDTVDEDDTDGEHHATKTVNAKSAQYELASKVVDYVNDVLPFYDSTHTSDKLTFMEHLLTLMPGWSFTCDSALENRYRSINITKQTVLDVLYSTASEAYQCIFTFDFLNRSIHADAVSTLTSDGSPVQKTDIYLSFDNIIEGIDLRESADNIKTKLYVYGQDLDIRQVNPIGTAYIINLDYFKNPNWMEQDLIDAIEAWEEKVDGFKADYADRLTDLSKLRSELTKLQSDLATLEGEKAERDNVISAKIEGGLASGEEYTNLVAESNDYANQIRIKKDEIKDKEDSIEAALQRLKTINAECSLENEENFSSDQYRRLGRFLKEGEYANNNYVVTDLTTPEEAQEFAEELYAEGAYVLSRLSQPSFTLSVDAKAFIHMPEFLTFIQQLELGCMVTVEKSEDVFYSPILLEMEFSWDDKEEFSLSFGNRFHLDDAGYTYEELLGAASNTSSSISANWDSIVDFDRNYKSKIADLINNAFNVALHSIISSSNQDIVWDASGLTCRKWNPDMGTYDGEQFKIINNMIAFTDDGWNTLKTIIGKIALDPDNPQNTKYGIVAEAIVGQLLAGENLVITNEGGTFRVDGDGVYFGVPKKDGDGNPVVDENGNPVMDYEDLRDYINDRIGDIDVSALAGAISSYYQPDEPYGAVSDVSADSDEYKEAVTKEGDLWKDTDTGTTYRYTSIYNEDTDTYSFSWEEFAGVPEDLFDKVDGMRTIYTEVPVNGFSEGDLWIFNSDDPLLKSNGGDYAAPPGALNNDLLLATGDSSAYNASLWKQYSTNIDKENNDFEFHLNDEGMTLKNGVITMNTGYNTITINPTDGIKILKNSEELFYADDEGNLHLKGTLDAASGSFSGELIAATGTFKGTFAGTLGIGGSVDNPNFSVDADGNVKITRGEIYLGTYNEATGKYPFQVDKYGNLYANNGIFSGNVTWEGQTIASDYLDLHGIKIYSKTEKDADGNPLLTFAVDDNGNVTIGGDVTFDTDSFLTWEDIEADEDGIISDAAGDLVKKLAAGEYTGGGTTFINGKNIYSPNIYTDALVINPESTRGVSSITFRGYYSGVGTVKDYFMISAGYFDEIGWAACFEGIDLNSTYQTNARWVFPYTEFNGIINFSKATVTGLNTAGVVAVFG